MKVYFLRQLLLIVNVEKLQKGLWQLWMPVPYYNNSTRLKLFLSCPKAIPRPSSHISLPILFAFIWKCSQIVWVFFSLSPKLSPPATVWLFTMAKNKQRDVHEIFSPCCACIIVADKQWSYHSKAFVSQAILCRSAYLRHICLQRRDIFLKKAKVMTGKVNHRYTQRDVCNKFVILAQLNTQKALNEAMVAWMQIFFWH